MNYLVEKVFLVRCDREAIEKWNVCTGRKEEATFITAARGATNNDPVETNN